MYAKVLTFLLLLALVSFSASANAQNLSESDSALHLATAEQHLKARSEVINGLVEMLRPDNNAIDKTSMHQAVVLLGKLRAVEGIGTLSGHLMFLPDPPQFMSEPLPTEMYYPAAFALVEIGEPAGVVQTMAGKIENSAVQEERNLAAWVIMRIFGGRTGNFDFR